MCTYIHKHTHTLASPAMALAKRVLPVPGGPVSNTYCV